MSLLDQENESTQNENINQNSPILNKSIEKTEQKLSESKMIGDGERTLPNSSDKKVSNNKINQQPNLNSFIQKTYAKEEEDNNNKDKIDNNAKKEIIEKNIKKLRLKRSRTRNGQ